jgi:hypothetical protein
MDIRARSAAVATTTTIQYTLKEIPIPQHPTHTFTTERERKREEILADIFRERQIYIKETFQRLANIYSVKFILTHKVVLLMSRRSIKTNNEIVYQRIEPEGGKLTYQLESDTGKSCAEMRDPVGPLHVPAIQSISKNPVSKSGIKEQRSLRT